MSDITKAIRQICEEKGISMEIVLETVESALAAAYRKDFGKPNQNIKVKFNPETGKIRAWDVKIVMEKPEEPAEEPEKELETEKTINQEDDQKKKKEGLLGGKEKGTGGEGTTAELEEEKKPRFNPKLHLTPEEAQVLKPGAEIGDEIKTELPVPGAFGRMAAQTAKQVVVQRLREAERNTLFEDFKKKEHEVLTGIVQRREGQVVLIDLGKLTAILLPEEQIERERYIAGARLKVYILSVAIGPRGPEVKVSRAHPNIVRELFTLEIPEIANGSVEIMAVAREAGSRSKVAVRSIQENIDPVGSCIGQRGARIQTIINELGGEKIDIIEYEEDLAKFIVNALSPAKVLHIKTEEKEKTALVTVAEDQLSLAIGRAGQNVRLAAKLTGWKIDIKGEGGKKVESKKEVGEEGTPQTPASEDAGQAKQEEVKIKE